MDELTKLRIENMALKVMLDNSAETFNSLINDWAFVDQEILDDLKPMVELMRKAANETGVKDGMD